jgi:ABC-type polysaccharide/polyol phosphate transport system ATPase subunit
MARRTDVTHRALPLGTIAATQIWKRFRADPTRQSLRARAGHVKRVAQGKGRRGWRWALQDVDLVVEPGESVGLVGINGSGKSTLLKILARVMYPYAGRFDVSGRVGALIEVRAGIHPELTGRENIHLYGTLLGLPRREVASRFDEIVEFAQLEEAIDRQVKFYSSGMQMRLGFGVAAFLEPHVLLVDEVLAVGDTAFQQRCIDRMRTMLAAGTTLVFVSHDLAAVEGISERVVWLHEGMVAADGPARDVLSSYRGALEQVAAIGPTSDGPVQVVKAQVVGPGGGAVRTQERVEVVLALRATQQAAGRVCIGFSEGPASPIFLLRRDMHLSDDEITARCDVERLPLPRGRYYMWLGVFQARGEMLPWQPVASFDVIGPDLDAGPAGIARLSPVHVAAHWDVGRT